MHILLTDETNVKPSQQVTFFVYGGIFFPIDALSLLDSEIFRIRAAAGFLPGDPLKFATTTRPEYVSQEAHTQAKRQTIDLCQENRIKFIAHVIHHGIIKNQNLDQQIQRAADYVIGRFNSYLISADDDGICIVDNLPVSKQFQYLSDKFTYGLQFGSGRNTRLERIKLYGATCINASNANSAMDIVLGSFRYCINNPANIDAAREMIAKIVSLMWHTRIGETYCVLDRGLIVRPDLSRLQQDYPTFKPDYDRLFENINALLQQADDN